MGAMFSTIKQIKPGIPQGSVSGTTFFNIYFTYILNHPETVRNNDIRKRGYGFEILQEPLDKIASWAKP